MKIAFTDGVSFETNGIPRLVRKRDGYYVVGQGMLCAVDTREEGVELIAELMQSRNGGSGK